MRGVSNGKVLTYSPLARRVSSLDAARASQYACASPVDQSKSSASGLDELLALSSSVGSVNARTAFVSGVNHGSGLRAVAISTNTPHSTLALPLCAAVVRFGEPMNKISRFGVLE